MVGVLYPDATGGAQDVFLWHNRRFLRLASKRVTTAVHSITSPRPGVFVVSFYHYRKGDPEAHPSLPLLRVLFRWNGIRVVATGTPPTRSLRIQWRT
ncbi:MAG: LppP/LprE family lipoprotein [Chloroflexota bacterium]